MELFGRLGGVLGRVTAGSGTAPPSTLVIPTWLVWLLALGFVVGGIDTFGILDNNEGLYAEVAREMLMSHDWHLWVIPHLNGLPYMEKPPLLYWLTALSFALFGQAEWAARLVPALSSLACVGMLLAFGRVHGRPQAGRLAALMFVSGTGMIVMSHVLMFDMLLTALLTAALMLAWRYRSERRPVLLRWSYLFLALAVMAKGFVAIALFGMVMLLVSLAGARSLRAYLQACAIWFAPDALLLFAAVAVPWHVAASLIEPSFAWFYFINEHVLRFLGRREPHDYYGGSWWYYLPRIAIYLFPWSFLVAGLIGSRWRVPREQEGGLSRFLLIAWLAPLIFFSVSSAKANYYLVAVMPFAAFHLALVLEHRGFLRPWARALPGLQIALLAALICVVLAHRADDPAHAISVWGMTQRRFLCALFAGTGVLGLVAAGWAARVDRVGILAYLVLPIWLAVGLIASLHAMETRVTTRELAAWLRQELPGRPVYLYRDFEEQSSLPFYLKHPVSIVDSHSNDLYWGNRFQANHLLISARQFLAVLPRKPVVMVVAERRLDAFRQAGFTARFREQRQIGDLTVFFN